MEFSQNLSPIAIGGLGGSGTRLFAQLLKLHGYYLGADLNEAQDNLWFTFLFKRRSAILENDYIFSKLIQIFFSAMQGDKKLILANIDLILLLTSPSRINHKREWLLERYESLVFQSLPIASSWAWKEPNTHIFIDKFLNNNKQLKYIHILRDPYYMAQSQNQNQLKIWGPIFFDNDIEITPRNSLTFWRKMHERILSLQLIWPDRIFIASYEDLVERPDFLCQEISIFLNQIFKPTTVEKLKKLIESQSASASYCALDYSIFLEEDVNYINQFWKNQGY